MVPRLLKLIVFLPLILVSYHTLIRTIRHFYKFPMPEFLANVIDNPLRRRLQPPDEMAIRHGIRPGMTVLEVGPGNGRYSVAAAQRLGAEGSLHVIDIEPKMVERVRRRAAKEGVANLEARVANAYDLPYEDRYFDLVYMITVTGEIPEPLAAFKEFRRVLKPGGALAVSEVLLDPDYPLASTVIRWATASGFQSSHKIGNFLCYTLEFKRRT